MTRRKPPRSVKNPCIIATCYNVGRYRLVTKKGRPGPYAKGASCNSCGTHLPQAVQHITDLTGNAPVVSLRTFK